MKDRLGRFDGSTSTLKSLGEERKRLEEERRGDDSGYDVVEGDRTRLLIVEVECVGEERKEDPLEGADEDNARMGEEKTGNAECLLLKLPRGELFVEAVNEEDDEESEVMI